MATPPRNGSTGAVTPDQITRAVAAGVSVSVSGSAAPVDEELWERRMKALTLRNAGGTFSQIAFQLNISATVCRADVRLALREVLSETTEEFIARQRSVLLDCQRGAYPMALQGDKDAIMAIVRCLEQEAKLLGLYAPARMSVGISDVDFAEQAAELIGKLGLTPPRELMTHVRRDNETALVTAADVAQSVPVDVGEVIDGIIERYPWPSGVTGFDIPAYTFPVEDDPLDAQISDDALGRAAAAAIDPERFGDDSTERQAPGGWSNL